MNNTNGEKFLESEKLSPATPTSFSVDHEAQLLNLADESNKTPAKMYQTRRLLALLVVLGLLAFGVVSASPKEFHIRRPFADCSRSRTPAIPPQAAPSPPAPEEIQRFKELLNSVEPASLHEVLHEHLKEKYQHGVYQEDRTAMEVVHKQNAAVAQSLVELAKRQASNTTIATTTVGSTVTTSGSTTSVAPTSSVTSVAPTTPTTAPTTSVPTTVVTSSSQAPTRSETSTQASTSSGARTSSQVTQTTASRTSNTTPVTGAETTSLPSASSITQQVVFKTTLANGAQSTVTSVTVVPANQAQSGGSSKTSGGTPSLQTNAASSRDIGVNALLGVLGMAAAAAL